MRWRVKAPLGYPSDATRRRSCAHRGAGGRSDRARLRERRLLPALVPRTAGVRAGGRLEQPLTYWNATGALAAIGFVLSARLAGDRSRAGALRAAAVAACAPLALGVYLSFSRGALAAAA